MISDNLNEVKEIIERACKKAGRAPEEVTLVAVSKTKPVEMITEAYNTGARDFGENYVQELVDKVPVMPEDIRWHMIGHLQQNKVKYIIDKVCMIHSVDSLRLAEKIEKEAAKHNIEMDILLEVNIAAEESKFGFKPEEVLDACKVISEYKHVHVKGLMTSAPFVEDGEENRVHFQKMYQLSVDINAKNIDNICMSVLSMGMTSDYEVAVEEGATLIRVGTAIFGARDYSGR